MGGEWGRGGSLFEAGRLLAFSAFRMGANSRLCAYSNKYSNKQVAKKLLALVILIIHDV